MTPVPLQWLNDFLINYNAGQVLAAVFLLSVLGTLPLRSRKLMALNIGTFGVLFALAPGPVSALRWRLLGIGLLVLAPPLYLMADD